MARLDRNRFRNRKSWMPLAALPLVLIASASGSCGEPKELVFPRSALSVSLGKYPMLEDPVVLVYDQPLASERALLNILTQVNRRGARMLLVANVQPAALEQLELITRGTRSESVRGVGTEYFEWAIVTPTSDTTAYRRIADATGTRVVSVERELENLSVDDLGRAKRVQLDTDRTILVRNEDR